MTSSLRTIPTRPPVAIAFTLMLSALWLLTHRYQGLSQDARIYAVQALSKIHPLLQGDLYLQNTSQDRYTLFSPFYARVITLIGLHAAAQVLTLLFTAGFLTAAWRLAKGLVGSQEAWLAVGALIITVGAYGSYGVFHFSEDYLTARSAAEALIVTALALHAGGFSRTAMIIAAGALLVHPLMALPGLLALIFSSVRPTVALLLAMAGILLAAAIGIAASTLPSVRAIFPTMDPAWLYIVRERSQFLFLQLWSLRDWELNLRPFASLALSAMVFADQKIRKLCLAAAMVGASGLIIALLAGTLGPVALLVQGQAWRWVWITALVGAILMLPTALRLWQDERCGPLCALLLVASWTMSIVDAPALAAAALALFPIRARILPVAGKYLRLTALILGAGLLYWELAHAATAASSAASTVSAGVNAASSPSNVGSANINAASSGTASPSPSGNVNAASFEAGAMGADDNAASSGSSNASASINPASFAPGASSDRFHAPLSLPTAVGAAGNVGVSATTRTAFLQRASTIAGLRFPLCILILLAWQFIRISYEIPWVILPGRFRGNVICPMGGLAGCLAGYVSSFGGTARHMSVSAETPNHPASQIPTVAVPNKLSREYPPTPGTPGLGRSRWIVSGVSVALGIACALLIPIAFAKIDAAGSAPEVAEFADWRAAIPPLASVYVANGHDAASFAWFTLQRANYLSLDQSAGVVFSRDTALEVQRRSQVLLLIMDEDWKLLSRNRAAHHATHRTITVTATNTGTGTLSPGSGSSPSPSPNANANASPGPGPGTNVTAPRRTPLTAMSLWKLCSDPQLGFLIAHEDVGFDPIRHRHPGLWNNWNLYDCGHVRSLGPAG